MAEIFTRGDILQNSGGVVPMGRMVPFQVTHRDGELRDSYLPALGLFGTAGKKGEVNDWRGDVMPMIRDGLEEVLTFGVEVFNPLKDDWTPDDAVVEARHLARDGAIILPVLDSTSGYASLAETGFAALGGTLRPQSVRMLIEEGIGHGEQVQRARLLAKMLARKALNDFHFNTRIAKTMEDLVRGGVSDIIEFVETVNSRVSKEVTFRVEHNVSLEPTICLVGSGAEVQAGSWYSGMQSRLDTLGVSVGDIYAAQKTNWSEEDAYTELHHKTSDAVVLFVVTEEQASFGAMGELGWLVAYCVTNGQKLGVYVERHASDPKSDENRQRLLAMSHLGKQLMDFPDLPVFVANSPEELALYGASELAKYKQIKSALTS